MRIERNGEVIDFSGTLEEFLAHPFHLIKGWNVAGPEPIPTPTPPFIPQVVTMRQARLLLFQMGYLATVDAAIATMGPAAVIEWEYSSEVQRDKELVAGMKVILNLTDAQLDQMFITAATL